MSINHQPVNFANGLRSFWSSLVAETRRNLNATLQRWSDRRPRQASNATTGLESLGGEMDRAPTRTAAICS